MKFLADEMLGKLARWLRMAGLDVAYQNSIPDELLVGKAREEGRVILTRDTRLIEKLNPTEYFFITHDHLEDQFEEFLSKFSRFLTPFHPLTRCPECNTPLESVEKEEVKGRVWPYIYQTQEHFTRCPHCGRIYWAATHVEKITRRLRHLLPISTL